MSNRSTFLGHPVVIMFQIYTKEITIFHNFLTLLEYNQQKGTVKNVRLPVRFLDFKLMPSFWPIFTDFQNQIFNSYLHISDKWEPKGTLFCIKI